MIVATMACPVQGCRGFVSVGATLEVRGTDASGVVDDQMHLDVDAKARTYRSVGDDHTHDPIEGTL